MRARFFAQGASPVVKSAVALLCMLLLSPAAWAQQASGISGVVRDTSGAVLPGVTVEAASPVLIEKVRTVVTDADGRYNIVDLRTGTYVITFTLAGFSSLRREGVELSVGFIATVNAELRVGGLEETITVTGAAPLVDTQSVRQQTVASSTLIATLPAGQVSLSSLVALTPGMMGNSDVGGAGGTFKTQGGGESQYHGKRGAKVQYDGMRTQNFCSGDSPGYMFNSQTVQEMQMETGGLSAETTSTGISMNVVPKEGSNTFVFSASGLYTNEHLQSNNLTEELRARGLTSEQKVINVHDTGASLGGPIKQDRLWFFTAFRRWGSRRQTAGIFWNKTQGTPFYTQDLDRPARPHELLVSQAVRMTWQASSKNKVGVFADVQKNCICMSSNMFITNAPESQAGWHLWPNGVVQGTWSAPVTNKLLLEAGLAAVLFHWPNFRQPGDIGTTDGSIVSRDAVSILESSTNFRYNAAAFGYGDPRSIDRYPYRFSVSYITGSHTFKVGFQNEMASNVHENQGNGPDGVAYTFLRGVPVSLTQYALPYIEKAKEKAELGIFAQDQWTVNRLTLNLGLRFDYVNMYAPEIHLPAGPFVPARDFAAVRKIPEWKDLNPRVGASYDLFGGGRTAIKASVGRYGDLTGSGFTLNSSPLRTSLNAVDRPWNDSFYPVGDPRRGNYVPDCVLTNFAANGECGPIADENFGKNNPNATRFADDVLRGWGARAFTWDVATEVQHQIRPGMSVTGGYYRNWDGNFRVTDNLAVTSADYDTYCITAPVDARLPGGGGYPVCGLYDIKPEKFGLVSNLTTQSSHYGKQSRVNDFFAASLSTRFGSGIQLGGGVDTGRTVSDRCFVVDSPQELLYCRVVTPWKAQTQLKLHGAYPLPGDFSVSGVFQNTPALARGDTVTDIQANYPATTAEIAPSLGRNLAGGRRTATVPLIAPQAQFEPRRTQLDLRLSKIFTMAKARLQANLDVYNALNANTILTRNNTLGSQWGQPQFILDGRMIQISGNLTF